jgi:hypothetical protein
MFATIHTGRKPGISTPSLDLIIMEYTADNDSMRVKRAELIQIATEILDPGDAKVAERLVDSFCALTPPLDPPVVVHYITINSLGSGGARSRKPGNLWLNWRKLASEFGDLSLTVVGVVAEPKLIPLAALSIWNKVWTHSSIELSREHATVLYAMWQGRDKDNRLFEADAIQKSGLIFQLNGWPALEQRAYETIIADLERLRCIERKGSGVIWLRESVKKSYA